MNWMNIIGIILLVIAMFPYALVYNSLFRKSIHADDRIVIMAWFNISQSLAVAVLLVFYFITGN